MHLRLRSIRQPALVFTVIGLASVIIGACGQGEPAASASAAASAPPAVATPAPRVSVNAMMVTMIDNAGHVLWDAETDTGKPKDEADWLELEDHAIQLASAGTLLQLGGTGQADMGWIRQVGWKDNADLMSDAALGALNAARTRNMESLVKANGQLVESCEGCHKAFKPSAPTEGLVHQRPHSESHK